MNNPNKEQEIREIAHRIWIDAGCPDGEQLCLYSSRKMLLKEWHWQIAENEWTYGPDYMRSW